ncbi:unnamed protein product, partial [Laminaria digitata]
KTDCERCHTTAAFSETTFSHETARFLLLGKHATTDCKKCHLLVGDEAAPVRRYRPLPMACGACHADYHDGAFSDMLVVGAEGKTGCGDCHAATGWAPARFDHAQVGWGLQGRHQQARCAACHGNDLSRPLSRACDTCHLDPHRGELGQGCDSCHAQSPELTGLSGGEGLRPWASRYDADAHQ